MTLEEIEVIQGTEENLKGTILLMFQTDLKKIIKFIKYSQKRSNQKSAERLKKYPREQTEKTKKQYEIYLLPEISGSISPEVTISNTEYFQRDDTEVTCF